jgi:hypothetical protein
MPSVGRRATLNYREFSVNRCSQLDQITPAEKLITSLEDQIPENHLLRLIDKHISIEFVRQRTWWGQFQGWKRTCPMGCQGPSKGRSIPSGAVRLRLSLF